MKLSVLIPVYNELATLDEILRRVAEVSLDKEVIIVDNCSTDGSREHLVAMIAAGEAEPEHGHGRLRVVLQEVNLGKGASVRRALALARGDYVIVQDADLEYDPHDYERLLAVMERPWRQRRERAVFGSRLLPCSEALAGQPRTAFFYGRFALALLFRTLYGAPVSDVATCYKLMRRDLALSLGLRSSGFELDFEIPARLARRGVRIEEIPISYHPRTELEGKKIRPIKDGLRAAYAMVKYRFVT